MSLATEILVRWAPRGTVEQGKLEWIGEAGAPQSFNATGRLIDVGFAALDRHPGVSGLSGSLEGTHLGGALKLQSRGLILDRHGVVLADNLPAFQIELVRDEVLDVVDNEEAVSMPLARLRAGVPRRLDATVQRSRLRQASA